MIFAVTYELRTLFYAELGVLSCFVRGLLTEPNSDV